MVYPMPENRIMDNRTKVAMVTITMVTTITVITIISMVSIIITTG